MRYRYSVDYSQSFQWDILLRIFCLQNRPLNIRFLFLDGTMVSTEVDNEESFNRDVGGKDELGTNEIIQPHSGECFF